MAGPKAQTLRDQLLAEDPSGAAPETPSQKLIRENRKANSFTVVDDAGRTIVYKNLNPLEQSRLYKALGDLSSNEMYTQMAMTACSVQTIDGDTGPPPSTVGMVEARIAWVDTEGYNSVWMDIRKRLKEIIDEKSPEEIAQEHGATLKKDGPNT